MSLSRFFFTLLLCTFITLLTLPVGASIWPGLGAHYKILMGVVLFLTIFSIGLFTLARTQTKQKNSGTFFGLFAISILIKFTGIVVLLYTYSQKMEVFPKFLVGMVIFIYIAYLIFETWFMMILGKHNR